MNSEVSELEATRTSVHQTETEDLSARGELDLFKIAVLLRKRARFILTCALAGMAVMLVAALTSKPRFSSTAVILLPQQNRGSNSLALQLAAGNLDLMGGGGGSEIYLDILRSRSVADQLIDEYRLKDIFRVKEGDAARTILAARTTLDSEKEGLIRITVQDTDRQRAADLANAYVSALDQLNQRIAITSAGQQRVYFEREMVREKDALADAEVELKKAQEKTGLIVPASQTSIQVAALENVRAQIRLREIELEGLQQGATAQNPDVIRLRSELTGLQQQLRGMQGGTGDALASGGGTPMSKVPGEALEYVRKEREVKFHESLFGLLQRQYESAKQAEAKTVSTVQVLDRAQPGEHKVWPPRTVFVLLGAVGGALGAILWLSFSAFIRNVLANPDNQRRLQELMD